MQIIGNELRDYLTRKGNETKNEHDQLVKIDKSRFNDAIKAYFLWKELNALIKNSHTRGINLHEAISEPLVCKAKGYLLNKGSGGDAYDVERDRVIEIKGSSNFDKDTTSFSPSEEFDELHFVRLDQREDKFYLYDLGINSESLKKVKVNKTQTLEDQQQQGRRPRFSIIKMIIEENGIEPYAEVDMRAKKIITL